MGRLAKPPWPIRCFSRPALWIAGAVAIGLLQAGLIVQLGSNLVKRRRVERALRESEERFRTVADSAPVLIWMAGVDKRCTFFNRPWLDFTGRTLAQETGATIDPVSEQPVWTTEAGCPEEPTSPVMTVPVQVTSPEPPGAALRMAKFEAEPSDALLLVRA